MISLEDLMLNGAVSLLTYLQRADFNHENVSATAIASMLCTMLNELNEAYPGITHEQDWYKLPQMTDCSRYQTEDAA